jgi:hypothetical protein
MSMRSFVFFNEQGKIYRYTCGSSEFFSGPNVIEVTHLTNRDYLKCYVTPGGAIVECPKMALTVTQNPFTITGIPTGTLVTYPGGELIVDDGFIEWSSVVPGNFAFQLSCFPYQDEVIYATFT